MPNHHYTITHRPPRLTDHFLAHGMSYAMAIWSMYVGVVSVITGATSFEVSKALIVLPGALTVGIGTFLIIGGWSIVAGLSDDSDDVRVGWRKERGGIVICGTGWLAFGVATLILAPAVTIFWSLALFMQIGMGARYWGTYEEEKALVTAIDKMHRREESP